jgi:transposase
MDVHQNARLTLHCRELLVERVLRGRPKRQVAAEFGISVRTVSKWVGRFQAEGPAGLRDRSCRPQRSPTATVRELELAVLALRRRRLTLVSIATELGLSRATVARICARAGLNRLARLELPPPVRRYERAEAGELLHLDVKKLGRITRIGHRITGDRRDTVEGSGWEYVHIAIDDASRVGYAQVLPDEQGDSATAFLRAAVAYYAALGVIIREVLTDNGACYRSRVRRGLPGSGTGASLHAAVHASHQRKGRAVHPDCVAGMGLRPCLPPLGTAQRRAAALAP